MAVSRISAVLPYDIERVWEAVTNLDDTGWRSELDRVERISETRFAEYSKNGPVTFFSVTACDPLRRWAFDMENVNMSGSWLGEFKAEGNGTRLTFTETVVAGRRWMRPFVQVYLSIQQRRYLRDLRRKLEK